MEQLPTITSDGSACSDSEDDDESESEMEVVVRLSGQVEECKGVQGGGLNEADEGAGCLNSTEKSVKSR